MVTTTITKILPKYHYISNYKKAYHISGKTDPKQLRYSHTINWLEKKRKTAFGHQNKKTECFMRKRKADCHQILTATFHVRRQWRDIFSILGNLKYESEISYSATTWKNSGIIAPMSISWEQTSYNPNDRRECHKASGPERQWHLNYRKRNNQTRA